MPPPPGASPAAAAHRPRGLPAGRSRVRGMSVRHRPPAGVRGLAAVRELPGSASGARGLGGRVSGARARGPGRGPSARISERGKPFLRAGIYARERPGVPAAGGGGFLPGGVARRAEGAPWRLRGTRARACGRVAWAFPGLGARRLSALHAVTAGDVSASPRAEGTRGEAGFWASGELCPLSCRKKPNQKANLQASKRNVTLSAGRERRTE